jgi:hypothetical protein
MPPRTTHLNRPPFFVRFSLLCCRVSILNSHRQILRDFLPPVKNRSRLRMDLPRQDGLQARLLEQRDDVKSPRTYFTAISLGETRSSRKSTTDFLVTTTDRTPASTASRRPFETIHLDPGRREHRIKLVTDVASCCLVYGETRWTVSPLPATGAAGRFRGLRPFLGKGRPCRFQDRSLPFVWRTPAAPRPKGHRPCPKCSVPRHR